MSIAVQTEARRSADPVLSASLAETDPEVHAAISAELARQESTLEMIASENFAPLAVMAGAALPRGRLPTAGPLGWPRVGVFNGDDLRRFRLKVSPLIRRVRATRLWDFVPAGGPRVSAPAP